MRWLTLPLLVLLFQACAPSLRAGLHAEPGPPTPGAALPALPDGENLQDRLVLQGSLAEMRGDLPQAVAVYRRALQQPAAPRVAGLSLFRLALLTADGTALEEAGNWLLEHAPATPEGGLWLDRLYAAERLPELRQALAQLPDSIRPALRIQLLLDSSRDLPASAAQEREQELERRFRQLLTLDAAAWERREIRPRLFWEQTLAFAFRFGRASTVAAWIDSSRLAEREPAAWLARCRLAAFQEDLVSLRRALGRGRALDSLEAFYPLMEGRLALADGLPEEALRQLREARRLDPEDPGVLSLLEVALEENGRLDEAESTLRLLVKVTPEDPAVWMRLAALLENQERRDESLAVYARALETLGDEGAGALLKNNYAYLLALEGREPGLAQDLARQAVAEEPGNPAFRDTLGWLLFQAGQYAAAEEELQRAYDLCRGQLDPEILEHLGHLRQRQGRQAEADALWQKALELGAPAPEAAPGPVARP
ncbi:MAG: tetratricopeptide repeat protein [Candidatus Delongbacteria bacterium]